MTCVIHCYAVLAIVSNSYPPLQGRLPTRYSPVRNSSKKSKLLSSAFYLHVLGTPPAFVLSQDQTLILKSLKWLHFDYLRSLSQIYCLRIDFAFCLGFYTRTLLAKLCSVFKVLPPSGSTRRLLYFIKPSSSCQELFWICFSSSARVIHLLPDDI